MGLCIFLVQVVAVIAGDKGDGQILRNFSQCLIHLGLLGQVVGLNLQVKPAPVKNGCQLFRLFPGRIHPPALYEIGDVPFEAGGQGDESAVVFPQKLHVNAGPIIKPLQMAQADQLAQVPVTLLIPYQQEQVIGIGAPIR